MGWRKLQIGKRIIQAYLTELNGGQQYSSYECKLGLNVVSGLISVDNCEEQCDSSTIENGADNRVSMCKLTKNNICRKRQNAYKKRGLYYWSKVKLPVKTKDLSNKGYKIEEIAPIVVPRHKAKLHRINCPGGLQFDLARSHYDTSPPLLISMTYLFY